MLVNKKGLSHKLSSFEFPNKHWLAKNRPWLYIYKGVLSSAIKIKSFLFEQATAYEILLSFIS